VKDVKCFNYLGSVIKSDAWCTHEIKSRVATAKAAFNNKKKLFISKLALNLRKKLVKCYVWNIALCGDETWALLKTDKTFLERFEMLCWRKWGRSAGMIVWKMQVLHRVNEESNIYKRETNWICQILRRIFLPKHINEGKIEGKTRKKA
jgi:hypothetical protein